MKKYTVHLAEKNDLVGRRIEVMASNPHHALTTAMEEAKEHGYGFKVGGQPCQGRVFADHVPVFTGAKMLLDWTEIP